MGLLQSLRYQLCLRNLKRNEYENTRLRAWFTRDFDVEIGHFSRGCCDRERFPARTRIRRHCSFAKPVRRRFPPDLFATIDNSRWWAMNKAHLSALVATKPGLARHPTVETLHHMKDLA